MLRGRNSEILPLNLPSGNIQDVLRSADIGVKPGLDSALPPFPASSLLRYSLLIHPYLTTSTKMVRLLLHMRHHVDFHRVAAPYPGDVGESNRLHLNEIDGAVQREPHDLLDGRTL